MLTLVHYRVSEIGDVQTEAPVHYGLSRFGRDVVAECNRLGIVIDCATGQLAATTMAVVPRPPASRRSSGTASPGLPRG